MESQCVFYSPSLFVSIPLVPHPVQSAEKTQHFPWLGSKTDVDMNAEGTTFGNNIPSMPALGMLAC